jgi:acyl-coenzyme A thioesterase PaaI-like protein
MGKRKIRTKKGIKEYTYLGCPLTLNRSPWCFRLCSPDIDGCGQCGRIAPHSIKSRIQQGIADHNKKLREFHFEKLEQMYLSTQYNEHYKPGIRVSEGEAEIVIPIQKQFCNSAGSIQSSICSKLMEDSAVFAVNSIVDNALVLIENFNMYLTQPIAPGQLIARSRFLRTLGNQYLAESVVTDSEGKEIARGSGVLVESDTKLSSVEGYK